MKKIILISFALSSINSISFSQNNEKSSPSSNKFRVGFNMGVNQSLLQSNSTSINIENKLGIRIGIMSNYQFGPIFSISPKIELATNESKIIYNDGNLSNQNFLPMAVTSEFALHAMFTSENGSFLPFFSFGPCIKMPVSKEKNQFITDYTLSADVSVGFKKGLELFNFIPELRYSHGLTDINLNPDLESMKLHSISLILNFR